MFCPNCHSAVPDGAKFCENCGAPIQPAAPQPPRPQSQMVPQSQQYRQPQQQPQQYQQAQQQYRQPQYQQPPQQYRQPQYSQQGSPSAGQVGFLDAIKLYFTNYVNFTGRASKSEFWWSVLFLFIAGFVAGIIDSILDVTVVSTLLSLGTFLPSLAIDIRRLHDIGKKWTWILMSLIPLAGPIILIVYFCRASDGDNQWGPGPRY